MCPEGTFCGHPQQYHMDDVDDNISSNSRLFYGVISFDNIVLSILTVFQVLIIEGWSDIMYVVSKFA